VAPIIRPRWPTVAYQEQHLVACIRDVNTCHTLSIWRLRKGEIRSLRNVSSHIVTTTAGSPLPTLGSDHRAYPHSTTKSPARCTYYYPCQLSLRRLGRRTTNFTCREVIFIRLYSTGVTARAYALKILHLEWKGHTRREPLVLPLEIKFEGLMLVSSPKLD
jgi:hypothetical protein